MNHLLKYSLVFWIIVLFYGCAAQKPAPVDRGNQGKSVEVKKDVSKWGAKDLWGDFDLLIGAYKNNLKITEVPVTYFERKENETKMNSLIPNASRMLFIVFAAYYKLRLEK